ncbi:hypothetical protein NP233_g6290 [Leucocoprinus birnbaumii]|uniref:Uncharacterized protein n=1 Tax=Leucocoprinus birnbaumii TaxID=56174 RepID=A0AAD5YTT1_9AGAR|nr:hypothetical protein NP233_g6290 [Leucocoprinus birnbaumii]
MRFSVFALTAVALFISQVSAQDETVYHCKGAKVHLDIAAVVQFRWNLVEQVQIQRSTIMRFSVVALTALALLFSQVSAQSVFHCGLDITVHLDTAAVVPLFRESAEPALKELLVSALSSYFVSLSRSDRSK